MTNETSRKAKVIEVVEGRTILKTPHKTGTLDFAYPLAGPNTFARVGEQLDSEGLERPTAEQTASLVYAAWQNPEEKYSKEIIAKLKNNWFWEFNGLLYVPNKGVYIQERPEVVNGRASMNLGELEKKLKAGDPSVTFVKFGYETGEQTTSQLAKHPLVVGLHKKEGAEMLAEVADEYSNKPHVYALENPESQETRVAALYANWDSNYRLNVDGVDFYGDDVAGGYASGISKSSVHRALGGK